MAEKPTTDAPPISSEFLSGGTAAGLEKLRARLLDLTNRNRLLNFRFSKASSIRIVDVDLDVVFAQLLNDEEISFRPVPEPRQAAPSGQNGEDDFEPPKPPAPDHAKSLGWNVSFDLNGTSKLQPLETLIWLTDVTKGLRVE